MIELIDRLSDNEILTKEELIRLIDNRSAETAEYLFERARRARHKFYDNKVYIRGLIELTNYCKNDCFYCGIRKSNTAADRYRLDKKQILECCRTGYSLGFRTFVLQGGEDGYYNDTVLIDIISSIRALYPDCAITLSLGERSYDSYLAYF